MHDCFATRLSFVTGKGGVGKSTLVAALALQASERGYAPLIVELGHRASMQAIFDVPTIGHDPVEVASGVFALNLDVDRALAEYVRAHVPMDLLARRIAKSTSLRRFFHAAPAVVEVLTLWRLEQLMSQSRFHPILVDLDATGHALMFLELPRVFEGLAESGPVRRLLDSFTALLSDRDRAQLHIVTLPGKLPVREAIELAECLEAERTVALGTLFVNRVAAPPCAPEHEETARALAASIGPEAARRDLALLVSALDRQRATRAALAHLDRLAMPRVELPLLRGSMDLDALRALGRAARGAA